MATQNITNYFQNISNLQDLLEVSNSQSGGKFWLAMSLMIFSVLTITFLGYGFEVALLSSAFISLVLGMMLVYLELISWEWLMLYLGIILFSMIYVTWNNKRST